MKIGKYFDADQINRLTIVAVLNLKLSSFLEHDLPTHFLLFSIVLIRYVINGQQ